MKLAFSFRETRKLEKIGLKNKKAPCHSHFFVTIFENIPPFALLLFFVQRIFILMYVQKSKEQIATAVKNMFQKN